MIKSLKIIGISAGLMMSTGLVFAQTQTTLSPTTYTIDPSLLNLYTVSPTTSTTSPSTTGTTTTSPTGTTSTSPSTQTTAPAGTVTTAPTGTASTTGQTSNTTTNTNDGLLVLPTNTTPPRTSNPPATTVPPTVTPANCPPLPTGTQQAEPVCPKPEPGAPQPVIPTFPVALMITPLAAVVVFWLILYLLNSGQLRTQNRLNQIKSFHQNIQRVDSNRQESYQHLLDFITSELTSNSPLNQHKFENLRARIQLFGSPQMQQLCNSLSTSFQQNDRDSLKANLKQLVTQIKTELH